MNTHLKRVVIALLAVSLGTTVFAGEKTIKVIQEVTLKYDNASFGKLKKVATVAKPLLIEDDATAAKYFSKDEIAKITKKVDFKTQKLVVFAWSGSGGDKLEIMVLESYPEQVRFSLTRGRTRDLRRHLKLYALRKNVTYSVSK